ncbi:DUF2939 domain-containing protein [Bosea caraganae]|nr:DUF2939 domain-containing protein [Bosea caraganae]
MQPGRSHRRLRRYALLAIVLAAFGYWISPYVAVTRFALAANAGRTEEIVAKIDVEDLRAGFARQIVRAYIARNPQARDLDPMSRQVVTSIVGGYVTTVIADYLTPDVIADLMAKGRPAAGAATLLETGAAAPRLDGWRNAWMLFRASGFTGPTRFVVEPDPSVEEQKRFRLQFALEQWRWLLRSVELPESILVRLADELKARVDRES